MSWHLAEILLFQANGEPLVPMLLEWIELGLPGEWSVHVCQRRLATDALVMYCGTRVFALPEQMVLSLRPRFVWSWPV